MARVRSTTFGHSLSFSLKKERLSMLNNRQGIVFCATNDDDSFRHHYDPGGGRGNHHSEEQVPLQRPRPPEEAPEPPLRRDFRRDRFSAVISPFYPTKNTAKHCDTPSKTRSCLIIIACLILSLLAIAVSSLVIYFYLTEVEIRVL